ncbi:SDR family oxidoreductase, partial [Longimicrobium sp.]|uniref:SDR family oxidoreductase n=1 Tax=Longimicrobium sp. TaxID=2029185 RepID=UPI002E37DA7F
MADVFRENVVVITGASEGIGRELALQLADQGAWLVLAARDAARLYAVAEECRLRGARAVSVPTDVADQAQCRALIERTVAEYGRVDTLVNNAGIGMWARFDEVQDLAPFERMMQVNYFGSVYCTHAALPHLKRTRGRIVGVSSLTGKAGVPTRSGYAATKHAMAGFFDSLRIELDGTGVTVTMIYPGFVATEIRERAFGADGKPLGKSPVREAEVMTVETCARLILEAAAERRRELVMTRRGKFGMWLKLLA